MNKRTPQDIASDVLAKIPGPHKKSGNGYSFRCPAHDDRQASAAIYIKQDSVAFKCFAGCSTDEFCAAIGITKADLQVGPSSGGAGVQIAYLYTDAKGNLLCEHLRMKPGARSRFLWRRYDQHCRKAWTLYGGWFEPQGQNLKRIDTPRHDPTKPPQIARNAAKVNDAVHLMVRKLGFAGDHSRLLVKLGSIAPHLLGTISCCHDWLAAKYGMSVSTVARDIQRLLDEQKMTGVELVTYTQGTYNPQAGIGYASKFRRNYLRRALEAISVAIETRGDLEYSHDALNRACDEVAKRVPRQPVEETAKVEADASDTVEKRADDKPILVVLKAKHRHKATAALNRLLQSMSDDGLAIEDAEHILSEAFNDATDMARARQHADHIETVREQPVTTIHDGQQNGSAAAGPSLAYGQQNDDHIARAREASNMPPEDFTVEVEWRM